MRSTAAVKPARPSGRRRPPSRGSRYARASTTSPTPRAARHRAVTGRTRRVVDSRWTRPASTSRTRKNMAATLRVPPDTCFDSLEDSLAQHERDYSPETATGPPGEDDPVVDRATNRLRLGGDRLGV